MPDTMTALRPFLIALEEDWHMYYPTGNMGPHLNLSSFASQAAGSGLAVAQARWHG